MSKVIIAGRNGSTTINTDEIGGVYSDEVRKIIESDILLIDEPKPSCLKFKKLPEIKDMIFEDGLTKKQREATIVPVRNSKTNPKINRNMPCPCGSGRKYKRCCGSK